MQKRGFFLYGIVGCLALVSFVFPADAQELHQDLQGVWRAEVIEVVNERQEIIPGTGTEVTVQTIHAEILEGERAGEVITIENDFLPLDEGQKFFMNYLVTVEGDEFYSVRDVDRRAPIFFFVALFAVVVLAFGGWQGVRSLLSLAGSLLVILYVLLPLLVQGFSPVLVSTVVAGVVLFFAIYFTHGFNRRSSIAFGGTVIGVLCTALLSWLAITMTSLTGFTTDESVYLNFNTHGSLDMAGLLLGAIIIGVLGVLDDIAITQVAVVAEMKGLKERLGSREMYMRAIRVGREHVNALVNTLVLAYTGAALPLLLLFSLSEENFLSIVNLETFASEIIRALVGSIGLILTVPITTLLAVWLLRERDAQGGAHHH